MKKFLRKIRAKAAFSIFSVILIVSTFAVNSSAYVYHTYAAGLPRNGTLPLDYCIIYGDSDDPGDRMLFQLSSDLLYSAEENLSGSGSISWDDSDSLQWIYSVSGPEKNVVRTYTFSLAHMQLSDVSSIEFCSDNVVLTSNVYNKGYECVFDLSDQYLFANCRVTGYFNKPVLDVNVVQGDGVVDVFSNLEYDRSPFGLELGTNDDGTITFPVNQLFSQGVNYLIGSSTKYLLISDLKIEFYGLVSYGDNVTFSMYVDSYIDTLGVENWSDVLSLSEASENNRFQIGDTDDSGFELGAFLKGSVEGFLQPDIFGFFGLDDILGLILVILIALTFMRLLAGG